jgi:hypothetical protein
MPLAVKQLIFSTTLISHYSFSCEKFCCVSAAADLGRYCEVKFRMSRKFYTVRRGTLEGG